MLNDENFPLPLLVICGLVCVCVCVSLRQKLLSKQTPSCRKKGTHTQHTLTPGVFCRVVSGRVQSHLANLIERVDSTTHSLPTLIPPGGGGGEQPEHGEIGGGVDALGKYLWLCKEKTIIVPQWTSLILFEMEKRHTKIKLNH